MVKGAVKVTNKIDKKDTEITPPIEVNYCFGDSKFLVEPSWTFFGDVTAIVPPEQPNDGSFTLKVESTPATLIKESNKSREDGSPSVGQRTIRKKDNFH